MWKLEVGCFAIFISVFYLIGFGLLGYSIWCARRSISAANWPTTPAKMQSLEVRANSDSDGTTYEVQVRYTYSVEEKDYEGSVLAFGYAGSSARELHDEIHQRLKDADSISARYDPVDPATSCLSYGLHSSIKLMLVFSVNWLLFVVGFTLLFWLSSQPDTVLLEHLSVK